MMKDTLEMIPIAVIMAIVLFFGIRSAENHKAPTAPALSCPITNFSQPVASISPTMFDTETEEAPPIKVEYSAQPATFIERRSNRPDVPYFTSHDLPPSQVRAAAVRPQSRSGRIRINTASREDLMKIPGIGGTKAASLISARPAAGFKTWNEVDAVPGFGTSTITMLKLHADL